MSFRARLLAAFAGASLLSLSLLAFGVRRQLTARIVAQHERRAAALAAVAIQDLSRENASVSARLETLAGSIGDDNRLRLALRGSADDRAYLLDWAGQAMRLSGLSMLQLQDESGRILSSGHFRNEFDRLDPGLPRLLALSADRPTVASMRAPEGSFLALAREDSLIIGDRHLTLVGGTTIDRPFLQRFARDSDLTVALVTPDATISTDSAAALPADSTTVTAEQGLAYIGPRVGDSARVAPARLVVTHSNAELDALRADVNRWFAAAVATAAVAGLALALWLAAGLSRPLDALTRATSTIALEGPELELATGRDDEFGALARRFGAMSRRLRASAASLRDAERRATVGEMARQVNHDIKNGLIPIRNVVQHLAQVQEREPDQLPAVFSERRATLESSIGYLDTLARNYARLTPRIDRRSFDASAVARDAARSASTDGVVVQSHIADALPPVLGDPVVLRRILDNLLRNAIESLAASGDTVTIDAARGADGGVRIVVADSGRGMSEVELARAFDDFHTTKSGGTGLGLSVVRRLTADLQGDLRVESAPGRGTTFTIELPPHTRPTA
ncbi:MAG TPA: ATP-binding protein [Gemmatimonadaceae bacterium]|nr:ATP-binding protein [Gemmatimonadaceae bacterium]